MDTTPRDYTHDPRDYIHERLEKSFVERYADFANRNRRNRVTAILNELSDLMYDDLYANWDPNPEDIERYLHDAYASLSIVHNTLK